MDVDPSSTEFGLTKWAIQSITTGAASVTVQGGKKISLEKNGRTVAIVKPVPEDVTEAVEGFKEGCVVTFSEPVLPVRTGEIIGCTKGYIHWEMFSPHGDQGAIQKLAAIDPELKKIISGTIEELESDNYYDVKDAQGNGTDEFKDVLLGALPEDDRKELDGVVCSDTYSEKLIAFYQNGSTFAKDGADDASTKNQFTYPVTIKLTNPFQFQSSQPVSVDVTFTSEGQNIGKAGKLSVTSFDKEYSIHVPAEADTMHFSCTDFFLDSLPLNVLKDDVQKKSAESAFFGDITRFRWRNSRIGHVSEWSVSGVESLLEKLKEKKLISNYIAMSELYRSFLESRKMVSEGASQFDLLKALIRTSTWWGRVCSESDPWGEIAVIGQGTSVRSLFGDDATTQLPTDAKVDNLHPVTGLWLLDLLNERNRILIYDKWEPVTILGTDHTESALYCAITTTAQSLLLGCSLQAVLVDDGYETGIPMNFWAALSGGQKIPLGSAFTMFGAAYWRGQANVWGDWELEVRRGDGSVIGTDVSNRTINILKPEGFSELQISGPDHKTRMYTGSITIGANAPLVVEGLLFFECCTVSADTAPDYAQATIPAICTPIKMIPAKVSQKKTDTGLLTDGVFIRATKGAKKVNIKRGGKFTYSEFEAVYSGSKANFQLNCNLYDKLELVRGTGTTPKVTVDSVSPDGCSLVIRSSTASTEDISKIHEKAQTMNGVDGLSVTIHDDKRVTLKIQSPADLPVTMEFSFGITSALSEIVSVVNPPQGSLVHTRPILLIPNGGHALLEDGSGKEYEEADLGAIKQKCGNDYLEARSEFSFPPVGKLAAGEIEVTLGDAILTSVNLYGDIKEWEKLGPKIQIEYGKTKKSYGKITGNVLSENWTLYADRMKKRLTFSVVLTKPDAALTLPALPAVAYFDATPSIGSFTVEETDEKLILHGKGTCIPSSTKFEVKCKVFDGSTEKGDVALKKTIDYKYDKGSYGGCDEQGNFEATLDRSAITDTRKRKFIWRLAPAGTTIAGIPLPEQVAKYPLPKAE